MIVVLRGAWHLMDWLDQAAMADVVSCDNSRWCQSTIYSAADEKIVGRSTKLCFSWFVRSIVDAIVHLINTVAQADSLFLGAARRGLPPLGIVAQIPRSSLHAQSLTTAHIY